MSEKNFYVLFSDSKKSEKVSRTQFLEVRFVARGLNAVLSEVPHRSGTTLSVAFSRSFFNFYMSNL